MEDSGDTEIKILFVGQVFWKNQTIIKGLIPFHSLSSFPYLFNISRSIVLLGECNSFILKIDVISAVLIPRKFFPAIFHIATTQIMKCCYEESGKDREK